MFLTDTSKERGSWRACRSAISISRFRFHGRAVVVAPDQSYCTRSGLWSFRNNLHQTSNIVTHLRLNKKQTRRAVATSIRRCISNNFHFERAHSTGLFFKKNLHVTGLVVLSLPGYGGNWVIHLYGDSFVGHRNFGSQRLKITARAR